MGIKKYNPYTPSRRHMTGSDFSEITKKTPEKSLISATMNKQAGRNNQGKITVRHRGGGNRRSLLDIAEAVLRENIESSISRETPKMAFRQPLSVSNTIRTELPTSL